MNRALVNIADAAEYLGTSERHIRRLVDERRIPYVKLGGDERSMAPLRFKLVDLDAWIDQHRVAAEAS